jgi:hypothetical protein
LLRRGTILLLLFAVVVQALPLRVCAIEQAVSGNSCHEQGIRPGQRPAAASGDGSGHAAGAVPCDAACPCEKPKGELDRHVPPVEPVDFTPCAVFHPDLDWSPIPTPVSSLVERPPQGVAPSVILPLLI